MKKLYAPQVDHYVNMLGRLDYFGPDRSVVYDEETYKLLDLLFEKLELIAQRPKSDGVWEFWLQAERGPIEAFGDYKEMLEEGEVSSYQEFTELWSSTYPDNRSWYFIAAVYRPEISYRGVLLGHRQVISQEATPQEGFPMDIHEFVQWLVDSVSDCIVKLKAGTYNKEVEDNLPPQHRIGMFSLWPFSLLQKLNKRDQMTSHRCAWMSLLCENHCRTTFSAALIFFVGEWVPLFGFFTGKAELFIFLNCCYTVH